jgi:hypothetical protein
MIKKWIANRLKIAVVLLLSTAMLPNVSALGSNNADPSAPGYAGTKGLTIYVTRLGDNSDRNHLYSGA